jgi:hypothetical protein
MAESKAPASCAFYAHKPTDIFQAYDEGSIPFTRSNIFNNLGEATDSASLLS